MKTIFYDFLPQRREELTELLVTTPALSALPVVIIKLICAFWTHDYEVDERRPEFERMLKTWKIRDQGDFWNLFDHLPGVTRVVRRFPADDQNVYVTYAYGTKWVRFKSEWWEEDGGTSTTLVEVGAPSWNFASYGMAL